MNDITAFLNKYNELPPYKISEYEDFIDIFWENSNCELLLTFLPSDDAKKYSLAYYGDNNGENIIAGKGSLEDDYTHLFTWLKTIYNATE